MKLIALVVRGGAFAATLAFAVGPPIASGADRPFALQELASRQMVPEPARYGTVEPNGQGYSGAHFVPFTARNDLRAGRYQLLGAAAVAGTSTTYVPPQPARAPALTIGQRFLRVVESGYGDIRPTANVVALAAINAERQPRRLTLAAPNTSSIVVDGDVDATHLPGLRPLLLDANSPLHSVDSPAATRGRWAPLH